MQPRIAIAGLIVTALLLPACRKWDALDNDDDDAQPATVSRAEFDRLEAQLTRSDEANVELRKDNEQLREQIAQLEDDNEELRWINDAQSNTIKDLGEVVRERDEQLRTIEQLRVEEMRLTEEIRVLQAKVAVLEDQLETERRMDAAPAETDTPEPSSDDSADETSEDPADEADAP